MLKHKTIPPGTDQPGFTGVTPSLYAEEHLFSEGTHGALLHRSTLTTDGSGWVTSAQGVLVSTGALEIPSFTTTLGFAITVSGTLTASSLVVGGSATITTLSVTGVSTLVGAVTLTSTLTIGGVGGSVLSNSALVGLTIQPKVGSVSDFSLLNPAGSVAIMRVATTTNNVILGGDILYLGGSSGVVFSVDATHGLNIQPKVGATNNFRITNPVGTAIITNPTGGLNLVFGGTVTGGTYNGQTISSAASFTGSLTTVSGIVCSSVTVGGSGTGAIASYDAAAGFNLRGRTGSSYDFSLTRADNSAHIMVNPTGTTNITFAGALTVNNGLAVTGAISATTFVTGTSGFKERGLSTTVGETTTWTPSFTNFTQGNGTVSATYSRVGKTIYYALLITMGTTSSVTGQILYTLPHAYNASAASMTVGMGCTYDVSVGGFYSIVAQAYDANTVILYQMGSPYPNIVGPTAPFTFTTSDQISVTGWYHMS